MRLTTATLMMLSLACWPRLGICETPTVPPATAGVMLTLEEVAEIELELDRCIVLREQLQACDCPAVPIEPATPPGEHIRAYVTGGVVGAIVVALTVGLLVVVGR